MKRRTGVIGLGLATGIALGVTFALPSGRSLFHSVIVRVTGKATVEQRLHEHRDAAQRIRAHCSRSAIPFPPQELTLVALKESRVLRALVRSASEWRLIAEYPILGASGTVGPKLASGDMQVPEGVYRVESLNPNSRFHLAIRVGYPNAFDLQRAAEDGRENLGGDIMIHGGSASIGCIAIGNDAIEEMFCLVAETGITNCRIIIAPTDLTAKAIDVPADAPKWLPDLYEQITREMATLKERRIP